MKRIPLESWRTSVTVRVDEHNSNVIYVGFPTNSNEDLVSQIHVDILHDEIQISCQRTSQNKAAFLDDFDEMSITHFMIGAFQKQAFYIGICVKHCHKFDPGLSMRVQI